VYEDAHIRRSVRRISIVRYLASPSSLRLLNARAIRREKRPAAGQVRLK
jgi:hypothetical protein